MIQQIEVAKMIGVAHIDNLLQEMLLGGETPPMDNTPITFSPSSNGNASAGENEGSNNGNGNGNNSESDPGHLESTLTNVNLLQSSSDSQLQSIGDDYKQKDNNQNFLPDNGMDMYQPQQHQSHVSPRVQPYDLNMAHNHHLRSSNSHMNQYNNGNGSNGRKLSSPYKNLNVINNQNPMYDGMVTSSSGNEMMVLKEEPENGY